MGFIFDVTVLDSMPFLFATNHNMKKKPLRWTAFAYKIYASFERRISILGQIRHIKKLMDFIVV